MQITATVEDYKEITNRQALELAQAELKIQVLVRMLEESQRLYNELAKTFKEESNKNGVAPTAPPAPLVKIDPEWLP